MPWHQPVVAGKNTTAHCHLPRFCILASLVQAEKSLNLFRGSNGMQTTNPCSLLQARRVVCGHVLALTRVVTHHCSLLRPGMLCSLGQPMTAWIFSSWSISSLPGKMGLPTSSSAKMQPTLHMSISVLYSSAPRSSSGGLHCSRSNSLCHDSVSVASSTCLFVKAACLTNRRATWTGANFGLKGTHTPYQQRCQQRRQSALT